MTVTYITHEDGCNANPQTQVLDAVQTSEATEEVSYEHSNAYHTDIDKACFPDVGLSYEQKMFIISHGP